MTNSTDERLKKELGVGRQSREMEDRQVTENREVTDDDRLEMFRAQLFNDALPDLPDMPGYHMCWLTTTNPRDPIHRRIQLGYEPIKASDVPGMEFASVKTGEWAGLIGVNEMIAFKLPETLYQRFMQEAHHDAPLREENKLAETAEIMRQQAEGSGSTLFEGDGLMEMRENNPRIGRFD
jgi:hypothetical protein|tara:strand:- start:646 stop:1185 length:540 start_codon:yes stop_codon:yes gene_type:complete